MSIDNLIVLKFGSSILKREADFPAAVGEIYRHRRAGRRVLAVVSATAGTTDRLLASARHLDRDPQPAALAALVATGEQASAALLTLHLERSGLPAELLAPSQLGLVADGPLTDASPCSLDVNGVRAALDRVGVAVVPGFLACSPEGQTALLGRGGSDLSALYIAAACGAECRLLKDTGGLFEHDPSVVQATRPRRYRSISWDDALRLDPRVIQPKGVRFAREAGLTFSVAAPGQADGTVVGDVPTRVEREPQPSVRRRVVLLGLGTVGLGVYRLLADHPDHEVVAVAVNDPAKHADDGVPAELLYCGAEAAAGVEHDLLVELIGGTEPALALIEAALEAGRDVVTANKEVIAHHGPRLAAIAERRGVSLRYAAAVGGALPAIETVRRLAERGIVEIAGVINGTTNFVLDRLAHGVAFGDAVSEAQVRGFAEADPTLDLSGFDAACKLAILGWQAGSAPIAPGLIDRDGIERLTPEAVGAERSAGRQVRHLARWQLTDEGPTTSVAPVALEADHPLADAAGEENRLLVTCADGHRELLKGKGAGRWPTAAAIVADITDPAADAPRLPRPALAAAAC